MCCCLLTRSHYDCFACIYTFSYHNILKYMYINRFYYFPTNISEHLLFHFTKWKLCKKESFDMLPFIPQLSFHFFFFYFLSCTSSSSTTSCLSSHPSTFKGVSLLLPLCCTHSLLFSLFRVFHALCFDCFLFSLLAQHTSIPNAHIHTHLPTY